MLVGTLLAATSTDVVDGDTTTEADVALVAVDGADGQGWPYTSRARAFDTATLPLAVAGHRGLLVVGIGVLVAGSGQGSARRAFPGATGYSRSRCRSRPADTIPGVSRADRGPAGRQPAEHRTRRQRG